MQTSRSARCLIAGWGLVALALTDAAAVTIACVGDCDTSGNVSVDELMTGVRQALGEQSAACEAFDIDGDSSTEVNEVVGGVVNALHGCPATATPVLPTRTPTPAATISVAPSSTPDVLAVVQEITQGIDGIETLERISAMAMSFDGRHLYVASASEIPLNLFEVDADTGELRWIEAIEVDTAATFIQPGSITLSPDDTYVYTHGSRRLSILRRDPTDGRLTPTGSDGVRADGGTMVVAPDGTNLYRGLPPFQIDGFLRDPDNGSLIASQTAFPTTPPASARPSAASGRFSDGADSIAISPDGRFVYASSDGFVVTLTRAPESGDLSHTAALALEASGFGAFAFSSDGRFVYFTSEGEGALYALSRNPETGTLNVVQRWEEVAGLGGIAGVSIDADDRNVYTAGRDGAVAVFSRAGGSTARVSFVGAEPFDGVKLVLTGPDSRFIYAASDNEIVVLRPLP